MQNTQNALSRSYETFLLDRTMYSKGIMDIISQHAGFPGRQPLNVQSTAETSQPPAAQLITYNQSITTLVVDNWKISYDSMLAIVA
jgi:hypothetical protein